MLEGTVRRAGDQVRVTAQLIEAEDRHHIWADRYDGRIEDIFDVQERIAAAIAVAIDPAIRVTAAQLVQPNRPESLDAWDHVQRGFWELWQDKSDANLRSRSHFQAAADLDPEYAEAYAGISYTHSLDAWLRWASDPAASLGLAYASAKRAIALDARDAMAYLALGIADYGMGRLVAAVRAAERALELNPSLAEAHMIGGVGRAHGGDPEGGIRMLERAVALSPQAPMANWFHGGLATSWFMAGDRERAIVEARKGSSCGTAISWPASSSSLRSPSWRGSTRHGPSSPRSSRSIPTSARHTSTSTRSRTRQTGRG